MLKEFNTSKDTSFLLYQAYYSCTNRRVRVTVKSGNQYEGYFVGFCKGLEQWGEPYILSWHFSPVWKLIGLQDSPDLEDCMIAHDAIVQVEFDSAHTVISCLNHPSL